MKKLHILLCAIVALMTASCEDDITRNDGGYMEGDGADRVTVVHLAADHIDDISGDMDVKFKVINPETHSTNIFEGSVAHNPDICVLGRKGALICRIKLGERSIPDGTYVVKVEGELIPNPGLRAVRFHESVGEEENRVEYSDLSGHGTEGDPYLINDDADFQSFIWTLLDDPTHAYGLHFRQTDSFDVPHRSMMIDGNIWAPTSFSGIYDGGGNELRSLTYQGASDVNKDVNIGLFAQLFDATVRNVTMKNALMLNAHSSVGIVAGKTSGSCTLENVTVNGTVTACGNNIGGLIGENDGTLSIRKINLNSLIVNGNETQSENVGLLCGSAKNGNLTIEQVYTPDHIFSATGSRKVGGLAGYVGNCQEINIKSVTLEHSVDTESSGTKIIYASEFGAGALTGQIENCTKANYEKVNVKAPVRGKSDIGALAGNASNMTSVNISSTVLTSVVTGENSTGGFFGYLGLASKGSMNFNGNDGATRYVLKSSADAEVSGGTYTGGIIGYLEGRDGKINLNSTIEIAVNVRGSENVGGAVGIARNLADMNAGKLTFSSQTMRVTASGNNCGGIVGNGVNSTISGGNTVKPLEKIPSSGDLNINFSGVVTAADNAGGIAGCLTGTVKGAASAANVTSSGNNCGGVVGYLEGSASSCAFTGDVSCGKNAGGIVGASINNLYIGDCVNLADLCGGENLGGIIAYLKSDTKKDMKIERSYNAGDLTDGRNSAGIIAYCYGSHTSNSSYCHLVISECGNGGNIRATGDSQHGAGGISGYNAYFITEIRQCSNSGDIHASTVMYSIGGVVGVMGLDDYYGGLYVRQCKNTGKVTCDVSSTKLGGIVGHLQPPMGSGPWMESRIEDCLNLGPIPGDQKSDTGGILGFASHYTHTDRTFNAGMISHGNAIIGTHSTGSIFYHSNNYFADGTGKDWPSATRVKTSDLGKESSFGGFDFNKVWKITSEGPRLRNCPF